MFRTLLLYRALENYYDVEIIGLEQGNGLWPPILNEALNIRFAPLLGWISFINSTYRLLKPLKTDLIIASKPRLPSFGLALLYRLFHNTPVIVDNDDDEPAMTRPPTSIRLSTLLAFNLRHPDAYFATLAMQALVRKANYVFCVSEYFRRIHGGTVIPHGLKPPQPPVLEDVKQLQMDLGLTDAFVVVFVGTPRAHKGIVETLEAARESGISNIKVLIVGANPDDQYTSFLSDKYRGTLISVPPKPYKEIPKYLALGNATVLAQKLSPESIGQMPAKLTDAMFAGIPIVATDISDIAVYLDGCGLVIPDSNPVRIAEALKWIHLHPAEAKAMGARAREVAFTLLSDTAIAAKMIEKIEQIFKSKTSVSFSI